jgi:heat-inducible transcriptional repressor
MLQKKGSKKENREVQALLGLVELYLKLGKPIGSETLKENGFEQVSSATLRNYFAELEKEGYLKQPHSSGGRIPTHKALHFYADKMLDSPLLDPDVEQKLSVLKVEETKNVATYLHKAGELLSEVTGYPTFLSSVRFDHDFILDVKLVSIDATRLLCILITSFGQIFTEPLSTPQKLSSFAIKRIENYFLKKLKNLDERLKLTAEEELLAIKFYNEIMVRYLVRYSNFSDEEIHTTSFSKLLSYPEFSDPISLATGLSLFENSSHMRHLLSECTKARTLKFWIGSELVPNSPCSVIVAPFMLGTLPAGAVGILGPCRMPYRTLFGALHLFSELLSETLTKSLYKFKLSFRTPHAGSVYQDTRTLQLADHLPQLLEVKES